MRILLPILFLSLPLAALVAGERDQLPLGHPAFYPSPERPLGWRGDGNGAFPGASLGIDRFADGPVKMGERHFTKRGKPQTAKVPYIDRAGDPVNIVWKFPLPGFTQSQPLIVGHKAIITCEPRTILCVDMNTGKELWRQELDPFRMIGIDGAERDQALLLESVAWTLSALAYAKFGNYTRLHHTDPQVFLRICEQVRHIVAGVAELHPRETKAVLAGIEQAEALLRSVEKLDPKDKEQARVVIGGIKGTTATTGSNAFMKLFHDTYKFCATQHWYSYVGWTWPTPVCDGTWLYLFMGQGQLARVAVADGSIGWFRRYAEIAQKNQPIPRSPLLHDGVFIVPADDVLYGVEAETGKELWRFDLPSSHNNSGVGPTLMHLASGRTVLASPDANDKGKYGNRKHASVWLHDPKTGAVLAEYHHKRGAHDPGPSLMAAGNFLYSAFSGFGLEVVEDGDELSFKQAWELKDEHGGNVQVLHDGTIYCENKGGCKIDLATGRRVPFPEGTPKHTAFHTGGWKPGILVGDRIVGADKNDGCKDVTEIDGLYRQSMMFPVINARDGQIIGEGNLLEVACDPQEGWPHVVPQAARFLGELINGQDIRSQCAGIPDEFSYGGLFAHGNRLLIPSITHLYCIGDPAVPFNGKPGP